ncbi:MAG TPA: PAS domain S-box protein, partial [Clostridia bacterium]|nr:PAS domain S-box protein [Clostridia bacterium]
MTKMTENKTRAPLHILWLEDDLDDREIVTRALAKQGFACAFTFAGDRKEFEAALQQGCFDLVLADYSVPGYDGAEALAALQRWQPEVPLIYLSGHGDEGRVVQSLKAGAADYVNKDRLQRLAPAIERAVREAAERRARHQAEEALEKLQKLQQILLSNIPFGIDIVDREGRVLFMNRVLQELAPQSPGQRCWEIYKDDHQRCGHCVMRRPLEPGEMEVWERPFLLGGQTFQVNYVGVEYEGKQAALRIFQNITERKQAEEAQARLAAIVTSANDGIYAKTLEGNITNWNEAAERIYGYTAEEVLGKSISLVVPPERLGEMQQFHDRIIRGEPITNFETRRVRKDGQPIEVSLTASPIQDAAGKVVGISMIVRDITERKQLEALLRQSQKMEAIGQLAGGVAHDFNNLLTVIRGCTDLVLMQEAQLSPSQKECLKQVSLAADRAANLTR